MLVSISEELLERRARAGRRRRHPAGRARGPGGLARRLRAAPPPLIVVQDRDWQSLPARRASGSARSSGSTSTSGPGSCAWSTAAAPDRARAMAHAAFGLINSTPHSGLLPDAAMHGCCARWRWARRRTPCRRRLSRPVDMLTDMRMGWLRGAAVVLAVVLGLSAVWRWRASSRTWARRRRRPAQPRRRPGQPGLRRRRHHRGRHGNTRPALRAAVVENPEARYLDTDASCPGSSAAGGARRSTSSTSARSRPPARPASSG